MISATRIMQVVTTVVLVLMVDLFATPCAAQELVEATEAQQDLNEKAIDALSRDAYGTARDYFQQSLALGELNITLVNLGNVFFKLGNCQKAKEALDRSSLAPKVSWPSPEQVEELKARYIKDLSGQCPGSLIVSCEGDTAEIYVDETGPYHCGGEFDLSPGSHEVTLKGTDRKTMTTILVAPFKTSRLTMALPDHPTPTPVVPAPEDPPRVVLPSRPPPPAVVIAEPSPPPVEAYAWLVGGAFAAVTGIGVDTLPETASNHQFDALDVAPVAFYVGATALVSYGLIQLLN